MEIPADHESSKLYISGDVEFIDPTEGMDESQQWELGGPSEPYFRVGLILRVDDVETFTNWIESSPIMDLIDEKQDAIFAVSGMLFGIWIYAKKSSKLKDTGSTSNYYTWNSTNSRRKNNHIKVD